MEDTKQCPTCCEQINAKATRCPRCQSWQSKWRFDQSNIKHQLIFALVLFSLLGGLYFTVFSSILNPKNFEESKSLLTVTDTTFNYSIKDCGASISVIGTIINNSDVTWKDVYFEIQFFNKENILIDTISENEYDLVILQEDTSTFKITGLADKQKSEYDHHNVIIKSAREGGGLI